MECASPSPPAFGHINLVPGDAIEVDLGEVKALATVLELVDDRNCRIRWKAKADGSLVVEISRIRRQDGDSVFKCGTPIEDAHHIAFENMIKEMKIDSSAFKHSRLNGDKDADKELPLKDSAPPAKSRTPLEATSTTEASSSTRAPPADDDWDSWSMDSREPKIFFSRLKTESEAVYADANLTQNLLVLQRGAVVVTASDNVEAKSLCVSPLQTWFNNKYTCGWISTNLHTEQWESIPLAQVSPENLMLAKFIVTNSPPFVGRPLPQAEPNLLNGPPNKFPSPYDLIPYSVLSEWQLMQYQQMQLMYYHSMMYPYGYSPEFFQAPAPFSMAPPVAAPQKEALFGDAQGFPKPSVPPLVTPPAGFHQAQQVAWQKGNKKFSPRDEGHTNSSNQD